MFTATEFELDSGQAGSVQLEIDLGEDGSNDAQGQGSRVADSWYYDLDVDSSAWGTWAHFDVTGQAATLFGFIEDPEFFESRIPYTVDVILTLDVTEPRDIAFEQKPDYYSDLDPATPSENYDASMDGMLTFTRKVYDQQAVVELIKPKVMETSDDSDGFFSALGEIFSDYGFAMSSMIILFMLIAGGVGYQISMRREGVEMVDRETSTIDAELVENEPKEAAD